MANITLDARQQQKHDTSTNFNNANKLYLEGEFLVETDTGKVKIGDGTLGYKSLPYTIGTRVPEGAKFTDTTYTAGTGLSLNGTSFSISNSGVTAGSYGPSQDSSVGFGDSIDVPYISVNSRGQITSADSRSITLPSEPTPTSIGAEPAFTKNTAFNKNFGTAAGTVCQGDDSRLSNARPASDVSAWAKAATKPTYTPTEVGVIGAAPTSGQVAIFDGTTGKIKSTGFTIATSVPANAEFTDTTYSKATDSSLGLVQVGYTTSGKNYAVSLDTDGNAYVNVPWENTTYTNGDGLSLSDGTFSIEDTGVVASLYGPGGDSSPLFGGTFMVPYLAVNSKGQILTATNRRIKIPSNTFVGASTASGGTSGLVPAPNAGQSTRYLCSNGEWSVPEGTTYRAGRALVLEGDSFSVANSGVSTGTYGNTSSVTVEIGESFNVPAFTVDQYGRLTQAMVRPVTVTAPTMVGATSSSAGTSGLVPRPPAGDSYRYLSANGTFQTIPEVNSVRAGLAPQGSGDGRTFLNGNGNYITPPVADISYSGALPKLSGNSNTFLNGNGEWDIPPAFKGYTTGVVGQAGYVPAPMSANKYLKSDGTWADAVYGIKGNAETTYRVGQVNLTAANIGALSLSSGGTVSGPTTFESRVTITQAGFLTYDDGFY